MRTAIAPNPSSAEVGHVVSSAINVGYNIYTGGSIHESAVGRQGYVTHELGSGQGHAPLPQPFATIEKW